MKNYPRRPPRLTRFFAGVRPFYFVTFTTHGRRPLLARPEVHAAFYEFCKRAGDRDIAVGRYVLMPDHAHLFVVFPPDGPTLPAWVRALRTVVGKRLLTLGQGKPHWQEGFFDHVLRNAESFAEKQAYVRENPVRAGLCAKAEDWPYQGEIVPLSFH